MLDIVGLKRAGVVLQRNYLFLILQFDPRKEFLFGATVKTALNISDSQLVKTEWTNVRVVFTIQLFI